MAIFARLSVPVPLSLVMPKAVPEMIPEMVKDLDALMFQVWLALKVMGLAKVMLFAEVAALMPPASVRMPTLVTVISVSAAVTLILPQEAADGIFKPAPKEPVDHVATSAEVGKPGPEPPLQLAAAVRSIPVAALVAVAARDKHGSVSTASNTARNLISEGVFMKGGSGYLR